MHHKSTINRLIVKYLIYIVQTFQNILLHFNPHYHPFSKTQIKLIQAQREVPKLFLYSKNDNTVSATFVEEAIKRAKKLGTLVRSHDFLTSVHVEHMRSFPVEYRAQIVGFLKSAEIVLVDETESLAPRL
jgi:hypothetical protein